MCIYIYMYIHMYTYDVCNGLVADKLVDRQRLYAGT